MNILKLAALCVILSGCAGLQEPPKHTAAYERYERERMAERRRESEDEWAAWVDEMQWRQEQAEMRGEE